MILVFILILVAFLSIPSMKQTQNGGNGNEITERYFAKYYIKVLIDYLDSKIPGQVLPSNDVLKNLYQQSKRTTIVLPLMKQLIIDFPTVKIEFGSVNGSHYFYHISNMLDIRNYYRDPIVSTFKPVLYIRTHNDKIYYAGFLNVPRLDTSLQGSDSCEIGYSTNNKGNQIIGSRTSTKKLLNHRIKDKYHSITSSCINKSTGEEVELNEIDCVLTGFSWDQPKYYEIYFTK